MFFLNEILLRRWLIQFCKGERIPTGSVPIEVREGSNILYGIYVLTILLFWERFR